MAPPVNELPSDMGVGATISSTTVVGFGGTEHEMEARRGHGVGFAALPGRDLDIGQAPPLTQQCAAGVGRFDTGGAQVVDGDVDDARQAWLVGGLTETTSSPSSRVCGITATKRVSARCHAAGITAPAAPPCSRWLTLPSPG